MFDGAGGAAGKILNSLNFGTRRHEIERLGGSGETRGEQETGDYGEEDMFDFHRRRVLPTS